MRGKLPLKITLVVSLIGVGVYLGKSITTRAVEPRAPNKAPALPRLADMPPAPGFSVTTDGTGNRIFFDGGNTRAMMSPKPGVLVVSAQARVSNRAPVGLRHRWFLRVIRESATPTPVQDFGYDDQVFTVPARQVATPTFHEEIPVPPGRYKAMLQVQILADVRDQAGKLIDRFMTATSSVLTQDVP